MNEVNWDHVLEWVDEGRLEEALEEAERLLEESPELPESRLLVGVVQAQMGEVEEALLSFDEALSLDPEFAAARIEKARLLLDEERYEEILDLLDGPTDAEALLLLASALYALGENEEAASRLAEALASAEDETTEMRQLEATLCLAQGERDDALVAAERAVALDPDDEGAAYVLGLVLTQLGRIRLADEAFQRAAELDPDTYFRPARVDASEFDAVVEDAVTALPSEFQDYLENVEMAVEDVPEADLIREGIEFDLLGLYQGATIQAEELDLPGRILLFQRNLENICADRKELVEEIRSTVYHEIAHHMGMDEDAVREAEEAAEAPYEDPDDDDDDDEEEDEEDEDDGDDGDGDEVDDDDDDD